MTPDASLDTTGSPTHPTSIANAVATMAPVHLAELNLAAELLTRTDRKYLLTVPTAATVMARLGDTAKVLDIEASRVFGYRSDYFDTPSLDSYLSTAHRRRRRYKVRLRTYLGSGDQFIEVKVHGPRGTTIKHRAPHCATVSTLSDDAVAFVRTVLETHRITAPVEDLRPALTTEYLRTTVLLPDSTARLTLDTGLPLTLPDGTSAHLPHLAVLETKSTGATCAVDRMLWAMKSRPSPISKFGTGLAYLRPELPSNRWTPVLRKHFDSSLQEKIHAA